MYRTMAKILGLALAIGCTPAMANHDNDSPYQQQQQTYQDQDNDNTQARNDKNAPDVEEQFSWESGGTHLGVMVMGMTQQLRNYFSAPQDRGVLVAKVEQGSAAERAGIRVGDVLIGVQGRSIKTGNDVIEALGTAQNGSLRLMVVRDGHRMQLRANLPQQSQQDLDEDNTGA